MRTKTIVVVGVVATIITVALATGVATADAQQSNQSPTDLTSPLADHADPAPAFAIRPQSDGSGQIHVTYAFDLTDDARAEAFEEIRTNETVKEAFEDRFRARLAVVAADAAERTGRDMAVQDVDLSVRTVDQTGIVEISLTWDELAAVEGDRLVITEPFASGFESSRPVHLLVPDGYTVASATPDPTDRDSTRLTWEAGTNLGGFEIELEPSDATPVENGETDGGNGPGFGVVAALLALGTVLAIARGASI